MARKNGCPMSVRDWQVDILSRTASRSSYDEDDWIRIKGLDSLTLSTDADTEDGSAADATWQEPYVTKRSGILSIEGKPVVDTVTGAQDAGQAELDYYATLTGCNGDTAIRVVDPWGHAQIIDIIVTSHENNADDTQTTVSWDTEIVGEPEELTYVQATAITVTGTDITGTGSSKTLSATAGATAVAATVAFTPTNASNKKYSVASADTSKVRIKNIDGLNFDIVPIAVTGSSAVNVVVKSMNNACTCTIAVTVTAPES